MSRMHAIINAAAHLVPVTALRQPGTGYGRSSGYCSPRSYATASVPARFRIA